MLLPWTAKKEGPDDRFECGTLPLVGHRAAGASGEGCEAFNGPGYVERLGRSHALHRNGGVQTPDRISQTAIGLRRTTIAIIALGFKRYGFGVEAARIARDISDAASHFLANQLPEL